MSHSTDIGCQLHNLSNILKRRLEHSKAFSQLDRLEEKIFAYGSLLKQKDTLEREIFAHMYTILRQLQMDAVESDSE